MALAMQFCTASARLSGSRCRNERRACVAMAGSICKKPWCQPGVGLRERRLMGAIMGQPPRAKAAPQGSRVGKHVPPRTREAQKAVEQIHRPRPVRGHHEKNQDRRLVGSEMGDANVFIWPLIANGELRATHAAPDEAGTVSNLVRADFPGARKIFAVTAPTCQASRRSSTCRKAAGNGPRQVTPARP